VTVDQMTQLIPRYQQLREKLLAHCKWMATIDRDEAIRAFNRYAEQMPWLELKKK
jgi:hypothetical protein